MSGSGPTVVALCPFATAPDIARAVPGSLVVDAPPELPGLPESTPIPPGWSNGKTRAFGAWYGGSTPPPGTDRRSSGEASVQLELGCAPSLVWSARSAPLKSPIRWWSVWVASSRDAWSPASAERWSSTADRRPSSEADTSRITDRSGSVVAVAASWFTSVASRSIEDSTSVHRADDMAAGVPIASSAATRSCSANPWELTARARECQARASRRREAIRAKISATTIAAIATSTQIHGEIGSLSVASRLLCRLFGRHLGRLLGRLFGRLGLLGRLLGRLGT